MWKMQRTRAICIGMKRNKHRNANETEMKRYEAKARKNIKQILYNTTRKWSFLTVSRTAKKNASV
jgi:hypothetical protein